MRASAVSIAALLGTAVLAGCGSAARAGFVAGACRSASSGPAVKLVLRNVAPPPRVRGRKGASVEVVSRYHGHDMTFPAAHPAKAVCEISRHRSGNGTATVIYKALRPTTITFSSTFTHATPAMMPAMLGRLAVAR